MPTPAIQAIIQGAPIRVEMKAPQGPGGKSAYQIAVENGFVGTEAQWLASLVGPNTVTSATTTNFTSGNVLFANSGFVGSVSRSGIDTRTSFPNDDVFNATTTGTPSQLLKLNSAGNTVANIFVALEGIEIGEEGGDAGFIRILNADGDVVTLNNANASNAEISLPTESGTLALTTDIVDSVTSATTSDGTANLSISNVTTATATVSSLLTANHIHGNIAGTLYTHVRTGEAVSKGDPVYVSGFHNGTGQAIVMKADASDAAKMPAIGVMDAAYAQNVSGANCVIAGTITSVDTDDFSVNSPVYVGDGGGFSETIGTIPQQVGIVERSNQNNGAFVVTNNKVISSADISDFASAVEALAPNEVTSATTSDGTATLSIANLLSSTATIGNSGSTSGQITIFSNGPVFQWYSDTVEYGERGFTFLTTNLTGERNYTLPNTSGTFALTANTSGEPDKLTDGTIAGTLTLNTTSYTYGTGAAAAHRTALGLTTLATTTPAANVATFLETPSSANLAAAVTDETGSGSLVFGTSPTIDAPTISGSAAFTSTTRPTSAGTGTPAATSLITRADFDQRIITGMLNMWAWPVQGTTFTNVLGSGDFNGGISLFCGAIAASSLARFTGASQPPYASLGTAGLINWGSPIYFSFIAYSGAIASSGINRVYLGLSHSSTTVQDLNVKGVGIKTIGSSIFFQVFGASLVTSASSVGTLTSLAQSFLITGDGTGTYNLFINGVLASTLSGGPTGTSDDASNRSIQAMCSTSDTFPHRLTVNGAKLWL